MRSVRSSTCTAVTEYLGRYTPGKNQYFAEDQVSNEVSIRHDLLTGGDLFLIADQVNSDGSVDLKALQKPLVNLLWLAGFVFVGGSLIALWPDAARSAAPGRALRGRDGAGMTGCARRRRCARRWLASRWSPALPARAAAAGRHGSPRPDELGAAAPGAVRGARPRARGARRSSSSTTAPARCPDDDYRELVGPLRRRAAPSAPRPARARRLRRACADAWLAARTAARS